MTVTVGRARASQQRRESAAERLSAMTAVLDAFDADLAAHPVQSAAGPDLYRLRGVVRALLPLALDDPAFDVTVTDAPTDIAVRVHHPVGLGAVARLVVPAPREDPPADDAPVVDGAPTDGSPADEAPASAARELAAMLRRGKLGAR
jgi:hypothetical protein